MPSKCKTARKCTLTMIDHAQKCHFSKSAPCPLSILAKHRNIMLSSRCPSPPSCMSRHHHTVQCHLRTSLIQVHPFSHPLSIHPSGVLSRNRCMGLRPSLRVVRPPPQCCCSPQPHCTLLFCILGTCSRLMLIYFSGTFRSLSLDPKYNNSS